MLVYQRVTEVKLLIAGSGKVLFSFIFSAATLNFCHKARVTTVVYCYYLLLGVLVVVVVVVKLHVFFQNASHETNKQTNKYPGWRVINEMGGLKPPNISEDPSFPEQKINLSLKHHRFLFCHRFHLSFLSPKKLNQQPHQGGDFS